MPRSAWIDVLLRSASRLSQKMLDQLRKYHYENSNLQRWEAVAPTIAYDAAVMGKDSSIPIERAASLAVPALIMDGEVSEWSFMHDTAVALAKAISSAQHRTLEGQTHEVSAEALAPVLVEFFNSVD